MGPQLYRCGNLNPRGIREGVFCPLQWGRNFIVAEIRLLSPRIFSTLWLQWGRNFIVAEMLPVLATPGNGLPASMGPQLYRCGNMTHDPDGTCRECGLQWGRNFIVAEISFFDAPLCQAPWLQWGRNFIVAEIMVVRGPKTTVLLASMGPQLYRCGNEPLRELWHHAPSPLQWGRNFIVAEMAPWGR